MSKSPQPVPDESPTKETKERRTSTSSVRKLFSKLGRRRHSTSSLEHACSTKKVHMPTSSEAGLPELADRFRGMDLGYSELFDGGPNVEYYTSVEHNVATALRDL